MSKALLMIFGALIVAGITVFVVLKIFVSPATPAPTTGSNNTYPGPSTVGVTRSDTEDTVTIATYNGGTMAVRDFKKDATTAQDVVNKGYYYLGYHAITDRPDPTAIANPPYVIEYIDKTQYFNITLLQEPLNATRKAAERDIMNRLGLTENELCFLKYTVATPASVSELYSNINLGFSFCPGATDIPE